MCQDFFFLVPTTTFIFPTATTRLLYVCRSVRFDMRILAVMMFLWYATVCFLYNVNLKLKISFCIIFFCCFFIVVFFNGVNLTILNSLYGQSVMLVSFATVVLFGLYMFENVHDAKNSVIIFFTVSSCLLLGSKLRVPYLHRSLLSLYCMSVLKATSEICALCVQSFYFGTESADTL